MQRRYKAAAKASAITDESAVVTNEAAKRSASPNSTDTDVQMDQDQQQAVEAQRQAEQQGKEQQNAAAQEEQPAAAREGQRAVREATPSQTGSLGGAGLVSNTQPITVRWLRGVCESCNKIGGNNQ